MEACSLDAAFAFASVRGTTAVESLLPCLYGECGSCAVRIFDRQSFRDIGHNGPKKNTPPLLFPTSVPFLTHVNFSRVFYDFTIPRESEQTSILKQKVQKVSFMNRFYFQPCFFANFQGKKPGALLPQLWLRPPIPKTLTAETLRCSALVNERLPVKYGCPKKCLTVRQWAVF